MINHIGGTWLLASVLREREGTFILFLFHATVIIVDAPIYGFPFRFINHNRVCSKAVMMKLCHRTFPEYQASENVHGMGDASCFFVTFRN